MKYRRTRGHKRKWKAIDQWVADHKQLDLEYLQNQERDYVKISIHPWSSYSLKVKSETAPPSGKTRTKIIEGLLDIFDSWKVQLDSLGEPYYLKIWLNDAYLMESQVVCAIGDLLHFYGNTFYQPEAGKAINPSHYGSLSSRINAFNWEYRLYERYLDAEESALIKNNKGHLKGNVRIGRTITIDGQVQDLYSTKLGVVWVGTK